MSGEGVRDDEDIVAANSQDDEETSDLPGSERRRKGMGECEDTERSEGRAGERARTGWVSEMERGREAGWTRVQEGREIRRGGDAMVSKIVR